MKRILILSANPHSTQPLRLDEEVREIQEGLQRSSHREEFEITSRWAVRPKDLRRALLDCDPHIVHFSGHGAGAKGLVLEDETGEAKNVSSEALARLFELFGSVECILLNACYTEVQAQAIHQTINCVIGMNQAIGDRAAISFATGFYDALGAGRTYEDAFKFGLAAIDLEGIPETATPQLKLRTPPSPSTGSQAPEVTTSKLSPASSDKLASEIFPEGGKGRRVFISYKCSADPDEPLALEVYEALKQSHSIFIDQTMQVGTPWAERIEQELRQADFIIVFLSEHSVRSHMVLAEVELAHHLATESGKPVILPVRVAYREDLAYPLSAYLNLISWTVWDGPEDTPRLLRDLQQAIAGEALPTVSEEGRSVSEEPKLAQPTLARPSAFAQPISLERPGGTLALESQFYIERAADSVGLAAIGQQGVTITIKGPRQMGKSSLLNRLIQAANKTEKQVVYLDFQLFDGETLQDAERFYREFCFYVTDELELEDRVAEYWQKPLSNSQRCSRYFSRHLLKKLQRPLVLAMDEVERIFDTTFRNDFFSMLRSWHNNRAIKPLWKQLDLALITSTEPYQLIADLNQSPFNVGEVVELEDFTLEQVCDLNQRHGSPFTSEQERQLMDLVNGQPYLVRQALYLVASGRLSAAELFAQASEDRGPFGDHLRYHLFRIYRQPELIEGLLQAIRRPTVLDERVFFGLRGAGLVKRQGIQAVPRCQLYASYFGKYLHGSA